MSKSALYTANTSTQNVAVNNVINLGSIIRRYGCNLDLSGSNITCYIGNWNTGGSALRIKLTFKVLCIKSTAL